MPISLSKLRTIQASLWQMEGESDFDFEATVLELFHWQAAHVPIYKQFIEAIGVQVAQVTRLGEIPYLPVEFFKTHLVLPNDCEPSASTLRFQSSGTTSSINSSHYVWDAGVYEQAILAGFTRRFGDPTQYVFLSLLPSYLEQGHSSLVYMMNLLHQASQNQASAFYSYDFASLDATIKQLLAEGKKKIFLTGVSYALLDFAAAYPQALPDPHIIMETGGMKGRKKEILRQELHADLCKGLGASKIYSEYGMTELLSQCYATGQGLFTSPPWVRISLGDITDPLSAETRPNRNGRIRIIDLANLYSCAFILTSDIGKFTDGNTRSGTQTFEVLGRMDAAELRGCALMYTG